jgi:hypothetical protein
MKGSAFPASFSITNCIFWDAWFTRVLQLKSSAKTHCAIYGSSSKKQK